MFARTLAMFSVCLFLVEAVRSPSKPADAEVKRIFQEALNANGQAALATCGLHFGGYDYKTYQREMQREGTTYYVTAVATYPRDRWVNENRELIVFKPKENGKAQMIKNEC